MFVSSFLFDFLLFRIVIVNSYCRFCQFLLLFTESLFSDSLSFAIRVLFFKYLAFLRDIALDVVWFSQLLFDFVNCLLFFLGSFLILRGVTVYDFSYFPASSLRRYLLQYQQCRIINLLGMAINLDNFYRFWCICEGKAFYLKTLTNFLMKNGMLCHFRCCKVNFLGCFILAVLLFSYFCITFDATFQNSEMLQLRLQYE